MSCFSKILLLSFFILHFSFFISRAQVNLVPNGAFESYSSCPTAQIQVNKAQGWSSFRGTPEYFNSCASYVSGVSVPSNAAGFQFAESGNGYIGFYSYFPSSAQNRESVGCTLTSPLTIGIKYYVSFKVCLSCIDPSVGFNTATNKLGIRFSTVQFSSSVPSPTNNFAQVYSNSVITDTLNWTKIFGSFIADSAYQYLAIGNFFDNSSTATTYFDGSSTKAAYYFTDDVCVSTDSLFSSTWTGVEQYWRSSVSNLKIYPNPFYNLTTVDLSIFSSDVSWLIFDTDGRKINLEGKITDGKLFLKKGIVPTGVYFIEIKDNQKPLNRIEKLIIE